MTALDLAEVACRKLLKGLVKDGSEIGFIIFVTQTPDHASPAMPLYYTAT